MEVIERAKNLAVETIREEISLRQNQGGFLTSREAHRLAEEVALRELTPLGYDHAEVAGEVLTLFAPVRELIVAQHADATRESVAAAMKALNMAAAGGSASFAAAIFAFERGVADEEAHHRLLWELLKNVLHARSATDGSGSGDLACEVDRISQILLMAIYGEIVLD